MASTSRIAGLGLGLTSAERAPLSVVVSRQLRDAIVAGRISLDAEMPSEKELARELGVGRSTIREALRILQAQGLLSGGDTVSTARPRVSDKQTLSTAAVAMENALRLGRVPLADLVDLRIVLEGATVEAAAARSRAERAPALIEARASVDAMARRDLDVETFRAADLAFHRALATAAGNAAVGLVMNVLRESIAAHLGEALDQRADPGPTMAALAREHAAILAAIEANRGAEARRLVTAHIREFYADRAAAPARTASRKRRR